MIYIDFEKLQKSLGLNCDDIVLGFLQSMLHADKRDRKSPAQLLEHPFIKQGEQLLNKEHDREGDINSLLDKNKVYCLTYRFRT